MTIGEKIRSLRKAKGKSQEDLAWDIKVSRQTINKWETNKVQPNADNIMMLCSIFEVSSDYFLVSGIETIENDKVAASTDFIQNKRKTLKVCAIVVGVLLLIGICISIAFGLIVFSPNTGDDIINTDGIEITAFVVSLSFSILSFVTEIVLLIFVLKNDKSKQKAT